MPGHLLPLQSPVSSSGVVRSLRRPRVLHRAFPFKLKYLAFSSTPPNHSGVGAAGDGPHFGRRVSLRARSAGGQGKSLVQDDAEVREWTGGRGRVSSKRQRDRGSDGFVVDERKARSFADGSGKQSQENKKRTVLELAAGEEEDETFQSRNGIGLNGGSLEVAFKRVVTPEISTGEDEYYLSQTRFDQCPISPSSLKGIQAAGYERMTVVQEATLPVILKGKDVLAKAKTGTGKTVAFLLPSIEVVAKLPRFNSDKKRSSINVLILCPTRELASQAAAEADQLLKYYPYIGVQVVIGGTRITQEQKRIQANPCQILVATPGRLKDHIENTPGFATRLMGVKILVLDEADRLLDMGFRKDIEKIVAVIPKQRQTLLFSATVPDEVRQIGRVTMRSDYEFINTVEEGSEETHSQVTQTHIIAPLDKHFPLLYSILKEHISEDVDYKVIVFCTTAMLTKLVAELLFKLHLNVLEIHSRKSQSHRTRVSEEFKTSKGLILVSSDVSARGVDYPDVTLVIQVGLPANREQYIHRLGRTGRKGKEGKGLLMLSPWEKFFISTIKDLPTVEAPLSLTNPKIIKQVEQAMSNVEMKSKESAYQAWLGYYNSDKTVGRDKHNLVNLANEFSRSMGLENPPAIAKLVLRKMGLHNVPGLLTK